MARGLVIGLVIATIVGLAGPRAEALVLCARKGKSGGPKDGAALHVRGTCNSKEVQIDPDALGLRGPQGAPGLVRAYGRINPSGALDANFASAGIVSARASGAYYCVKLDPSINALTAVATVGLDGNEVLGTMVSGANSSMFFAVTLHGSGVCNQGNELAVATGELDFTAGSLTSAGFGPAFSFYIQVS
ncbi:MAG: hypothetical protein ACREQL_04140 [Candidatus Binatia bacterium]